MTVYLTSFLQEYVVAIVVPDQTGVEDFCREEKIDPRGFLLFSNTKEKDLFTQKVLKAMRSAGDAGGLAQPEQVKSIFVTSEAFTPENNLATPTLMNRRAELRKYFRDTIIALYTTGPMIAE